MAPASASVFLLFFLAISFSLAWSGPIPIDPYYPREKRGEKSEENPYVYDRESFITRAKSGAGLISALPNFREQHELLRGIEDYRITYIEMKPNSIMTPHSIDALWYGVVCQGRGYFAYVRENNLVLRKLEEGDVFVLPPGRIFYLINSDDREPFRSVNLLATESTPGRYQAYYFMGKRSVFSAFSDETLEAAMGSREAAERMKRQEQEEGVIIQISKDEIQRIIREARKESLPMPAAHEPQPLNLFNEKPFLENNYGRLIEAFPRTDPHSRFIDLLLGYVELRPGAMVVPNYNTRATKIVVVIEGEGELEMACPHLSGGRGGSYEGESEEEQREISYERVRATLREGIVFIVPANHPSTLIAHSGAPLRAVCFEVNALGNNRHFITGGENVLKVLDRRVVGRVLRMSAEEVDRMLEEQRIEPLTSGPHARSGGRGRGGRGDVEDGKSDA